MRSECPYSVFEHPYSVSKQNHVTTHPDIRFVIKVQKYGNAFSKSSSIVDHVLLFNINRATVLPYDFVGTDCRRQIANYFATIQTGPIRS